MGYKNTYLFLRHGKTIADPNVPAPEWELEENALHTIQEHINNGRFDGVDVIITSEEPKAVATANLIEKHLNVKSVSMEDFNEVKRSPNFLTEEQFLEEKKKQLTDWDYVSKYFPESANEALSRFKSGLEKLNQEYSNKKILVVSHGTVLSIFYADLNNTKDRVFTDWNDLGFCDLQKVKTQR